MHAVFDSNPRLCGEQEGGGTTGDGCPKVELHKTWGNQTALWCCDCGRYGGTAVSVGGPGQGGFRINSGQQTRDGSTADLVPAKGLKELSGVWRMLQAAAPHVAMGGRERGQAGFPSIRKHTRDANPTVAGRCPHRRLRCCRGLETRDGGLATRPSTSPRQSRERVTVLRRDVPMPLSLEGAER